MEKLTVALPRGGNCVMFVSVLDPRDGDVTDISLEIEARSD
jgi:hypothetical protein